MLITKKLGIEADSEDLCPSLSIKVTSSLKCGQKTKLVNFCAYRDLSKQFSCPLDGTQSS